jgi:gamma-glutamylcyclotransferase (GGCT)/AIG2-like uncharacterized protein YtfP
MNRIFTYGSLMSGFGNHRLLARARLVGAARTLPRFTLVSLGAFPAMLEGGATAVVGELYDVDDDTLAALDRLEGHPSLYTRTPIALAGRRRAEAYVLPAARAKGYPVIETGDWRRFRCGSS